MLDPVVFSPVLFDPDWPWVQHQADDCTCPGYASASAGHNPMSASCPPGQIHVEWCAVTPLYAQVFAGTAQPRYPWWWPELIGHFPECTCDDESCEIHGDDEWLRRYVVQCGLEVS